MLSRWIATYSHVIPDPVKDRTEFLYWHLKALEGTLVRLVYDDQTVETEYGVQLRIDPVDLAQRRFVSDGEMDETAMVEYFLEEIRHVDGDFLDVGANVGIYSILFRDRIDDGSRALAFEPLESNVDRIKSNAELNGIDDIEVYPVALGDRNGKAEVHYDPSNVGAASLAARQGALRRTIDVRRLDDLKLPSENIGIVKIDVEGAELDVLKGAKSTLSSSRPGLLVELHPEILDDRGQSLEGLLSLVADLGYREVELVAEGERVEIEALSHGRVRDEHAIYFLPKR